MVLYRDRMVIFCNIFLNTESLMIIFELHQLLRCGGVHPRFGGHAAVQALADDAQDVSVQMVFVVWRLHRQYAVFKMQSIVGVGFGRSVDQVHVLVHVHGAVVRGSAGQGTGEFHIVRQISNIDSEFLHAIVCRVQKR